MRPSARLVQLLPQPPLSDLSVLAHAAWLERRRADLLPTEYFHVVFTVPPAIAEIAAHNKAVLYGLLFRAVAETLRTIAADPRHLDAEIGFSPGSGGWNARTGDRRRPGTQDPPLPWDPGAGSRRRADTSAAGKTRFTGAKRPGCSSITATDLRRTPRISAVPLR